MNILFTAITFLPDIGGSELGLARLINAIEKEAFANIFILSPNHHKAHLQKIFPQSHIFVTPDNVKEKHVLWYELVFFFKLLFIILWYRIDVVNCHWAHFPAQLIRYVAKITRTPYIITVCGGDINTVSEITYGTTLNPHNKKMVSKNLAAATHIVAKSPSLKRRVHELIGNDKKVSVVPNILFNDDKINRTNPEKMILTVARNDKIKNYALALESIKHLAENTRDFTYVIIGKDTEKLMPFVIENNLQDVIQILGKQDEQVIKSYFEKASVFFLTSYCEGSPQVCFQALSYGLPLVLRQSPGLSDLVKPEGVFEGGASLSNKNLADMLFLYINKCHTYLTNKDRIKEITSNDIVKKYYNIFLNSMARETLFEERLWYK